MGLLTYEEMEVGEPFQPLEYVLTPERVRAYRGVAGEQPEDSALVTPQVFAFDWHTVRNRHGNTQGGLHAKQAFHFHHPAKAGMRVRVEARLADKYERRGYRYTVVAAKISDSQGLLLVEGASTVAISAGGLQQAKPPRGQAAPLPAPGPDDPPALTRRLREAQMAAYWHQVCGRPEEGGHSSNAVAQQAGLPAALAQGNMVLCWLGGLLGQHFGEVWCRGGGLDVRIVGRMFEGDALTFRATRSHEPGQSGPTDAVLDVSCQNQRGELTIIGTARVPRAAN